jgi:hypothetical protein
MKSTIKTVLNNLFFINIFNDLKSIDKETFKFIGGKIFLFLFPLIFVTIVFNFSIICYMFLSWDIPNSFYFPFITGGDFQGFFDRLLTLIGFMFMLSSL